MAKDTKYTVVSPSGRFVTVGQEVTEEQLKADAHHEKYLRTGSIVKSSDAAKAQGSSEDTSAKAADLQQKIADLQAQLDALQGTPVEANAPAQVRLDVDPTDHPTQTEAEETRAAGKEVVQPTAGDVNLGEVQPGEASDAASAAAKKGK